MRLRPTRPRLTRVRNWREPNSKASKKDTESIRATLQELSQQTKAARESKELAQAESSRSKEELAGLRREVASREEELKGLRDRVKKEEERRLAISAEAEAARSALEPLRVELAKIRAELAARRGATQVRDGDVWYPSGKPPTPRTPSGATPTTPNQPSEIGPRIRPQQRPRVSRLAFLIPAHNHDRVHHPLRLLDGRNPCRCGYRAVCRRGLPASCGRI